MIKFSIIIPVYNEEKAIKEVIADLKKHLAEQDYHYEIIVVNDGSTDQTKEILQQISGIKTINHIENRGYGAALKSGIKQAKEKYILIVDGDGTYPIKAISELVAWADYDMVVGARINPRVKIPLIRKPPKWFLNQLANYLTGIKIPDLNSGLRLFKKNVFKGFIHLLPDGFSLTTTITLALLTNNYRVKYLPIDYYKREGKSKIKPLQDTLNFLQLIIRTILYFNPLKIFVPLSLILLLLGLAIFILSYLFTPKAMDLTTAVFIISSVQILAIGMLADLISKKKL